jgi:hypothetical protein
MATIVWMLIWIGCAQEGYRNHDLELLTSYRAKDMCSCVFVQERDEDYCRDWTVASPNLATLSVNVETQSVSTEALQYWSATAVYMGTEVGCVLQ